MENKRGKWKEERGKQKRKVERGKWKITRKEGIMGAMNSQEGPLQQKSYRFAVEIVLFCKDMVENQREYVLSKQLMKSGTSIGANIEESQHAQSKDDFISKLSISLKEAYESRFWIRLLHETGYLLKEKFDSFFNQVNEIISMLVASINTAKRNNL